MRLINSFALAFSIVASAANAAPPNVVVDIAPIQSLVAKVMGDLGEPHLLMAPGSSPHDYALRPSDARALSGAALVVWIGADLTPWLAGPLDTLAPEAVRVSLNDVDGAVLLPARDEALFEGHDDHGNEAEEGLNDPHSWLDPENARIWLGVIGHELAMLDPENAATYLANAARAEAEIADLVAELEVTLAPVLTAEFVVFHDAYQYFESRFGLHVSGAISLVDGSAPSPARIAELRAGIAGRGVACVFAEPQFNPGLVEALTEGGAISVGVLDPMGATIATGPEHYDQTLRDIASAIVDCASGQP